MAGRKFSMMDYLNARCASMQPLFGFDAQDEREAKLWRVKALAKMRDLLGEMPEAVPLAPDIVESVDMGNYVREKVIFDADSWSSIPGYVLIPKRLTGPAPTLLCLHGHGPGKDPVAGVTTPRPGLPQKAMEDAIRRQNSDYGRQFAERGYVTFAFDFRCFGERGHVSPDLHGRDSCDVHFIRGIMLGINLLALHLADIARSIDYLQTRPEVDRDRIGCMGLSLGGAMTLFATAVDKRIRAACVSGYLNEYEACAVQMADICGSQVLPMLRRYFDISDIASAIAPKPLLIESGARDASLPLDSSKRAFECVKRAYLAWGKPERLAQDIFDGGNRFSGAKAFDWFARWL